MQSRFLVTISIAALALVACGGDDDGGGGGGNSPQDQVADMMMDVLDETTGTEEMEGVTIDEDCIRDKVDQLSDEDAQLILDAGTGPEPEGLSDSANEIGETILECVDFDLPTGDDG